MNGAGGGKTNKKKVKSKTPGSAILTTGSFEKPNPKGCATQFRGPPHLRGIIRSILGEVNMGGVDLHRRILELEEQVNNLVRDKRELEKKIEELTPRKMFMATLDSNKPPYWVEA